VLVLEMGGASPRAAAIAASQLIGRGDEKSRRRRAVEAMRRAFERALIDGTVVIGEGERDEAPMLFIARMSAAPRARARRIDIALDPLEGTTITGQGRAQRARGARVAEKAACSTRPTSTWTSSRSVPAIPTESSIWRKSDDRQREAGRRGQGRVAPPRSSSACSTDGRGTRQLIAELRALGCGIQLIPDGDVAGVIAVTDRTPRSTSTWARAARPKACSRRGAALRRRPVQRPPAVPQRRRAARARKWGIDDLDRIYKLEELAKGDCIFAATGVTDGSLLEGVKRRRGGTMTTESVGDARRAPGPFAGSGPSTIRANPKEHYLPPN
jgi:fructose-1,6-bisphosphatase II / sedoheptulose-1,7-bisphosphatase